MGVSVYRAYVAPLVPALAAYAVLMAVAVSVPGMWQPVALVLFYVVLGQAFNIFLGMTGYVNFGYVAFLALGAYGMALAVEHLATAQLGYLAILAGLLLGGLMAVMLSSVVGAIALRLRGAYFAIATIGVNEGFRFLIEGTGIWGGSEGIIISRSLREMFGRETANFLATTVADVIVLAVGVLASLVTVYMVNSRMGYALRAIREDEDAAKVLGVNVVKYKMLAFITSTFFAGLLGASAWTLKTTHVFPEDVFNILYTIEAIVIVMLGGSGTLLGPIVGGVIYGSLRYYLGTLLPGFQLLLLAPILVAFVTFFPQGVVGWVKFRVRGTRLERFVA